jgi:hypothetical protein
MYQSKMKENESTDPTAEKVEQIDESSHPTAFHREVKTDIEDHSRGNLNAVFENPLAGISREQLFKNVEEFCSKYDLIDHVETFKKGALISQDPASATSLPELSDDEKEALEREHTHKWSQPWQLYFLACMSPDSKGYEPKLTSSLQAMCSVAAAVQGMDETVNNGAQAIYFAEDVCFLHVSAPYRP